MAFAAARMILKDKRRKSKEDFAPTPVRNRSKVCDVDDDPIVEQIVWIDM